MRWRATVTTTTTTTTMTATPKTSVRVRYPTNAALLSRQTQSAGTRSGGPAGDFDPSSSGSQCSCCYGSATTIDNRSSSGTVNRDPANSPGCRRRRASSSSLFPRNNKRLESWPTGSLLVSGGGGKYPWLPLLMLCLGKQPEQSASAAAGAPI